MNNLSFPDMQVSGIYFIDREPSEREAIMLEQHEPYNQLHKQLEYLDEFRDEIQERRLKWALKNWSSPYPETNGQTGGVTSPDAVFASEKNRSNCCQKNAAWFQGVETGDFYLKPLDCYKQWCPICGGLGGVIHRTRQSAILSRVSLAEYDLRQLVLTVPEDVYESYKSRDSLNSLLSAGKRLVERYFGVPVFDSQGRIKKYRLDVGCIGYLHLFGDKNPDEFMPHVNIHIVVPKGEKLKISKQKLESMRDSWGRALRGMGRVCDQPNIFYSFRSKPGKAAHAIKYMCRPWTAENLEATSDDVKRLIVVQLKGFQYLRFWGALANCRYKDEMEIDEIQETVKTKIGEEINFLFIAEFERKCWDSLQDLGDNYFKISGGSINGEKRTKGG